jgi:hypothetical protein
LFSPLPQFTRFSPFFPRLLHYTHGLVWVITVLVMKGGPKGVEFAIKIIFLIVAAILVFLGSIFIGVGAIVAFLFTLVQKILEFVFYPADIVFDKLWSYVDKRDKS